MPKKPAKTQEQLVAENEDLRARLDEAEETLRAIRSGEVDALVVPGVGGDQLYTLTGADRSYRVLIEEMNDGALTLTADGVILYANRHFAEMLKSPLEKVIGSTIHTWIALADQEILQSLLRKGATEQSRDQLALTASDGTQVPVDLSVSKLLINETPDSFCLVATDLTEQKRNEAILDSEKLARELLTVANQSRLALLSVIEDQKQAEESLSNSEKRFRALIENNSDAIVLLSAEGKITYRSPTAYRLMGLEPTAPQDNSMLRAVHPDDVKDTSKAFAQILQTPGKPVLFQYRVQHSDGSWRWVEGTGTNLLTEPAVHAIVTNYRDITERKQAENLQIAVYHIAQASELVDSLTDLFPQIQRIISEVMPAENFYIALYDQASNRLSFPYSIDEVDKTYSGEEIEPGRGLTAYVLRTGKSLLCTESIHKKLVEQGEVKLIGAPMLIWLGVPLIAHSKVIGVMVVQHYSNPHAYGEREQRMLEFVSSQVALAIDRKQAQEVLAASEAELRALFASMHDAVLVIDREGVYREIAPTNPAFWYLPPQELLGKRLQDVFPAEQSEIFDGVIQQVLATKQTTQIEYELIVGNQSVWYDASISPLSADSTLWVARDITERKRAETLLLEGRQRLALATESAHIGIWDLNPVTNQLVWDTQMYELYGIREQDFSGAYDAWLNGLHPEDRDRAEAELTAALEGTQDFHSEFRVVWPNGEVHDIEAYAVVQRANNDSATRAIGVNWDITERKRAEETLRDSEERYRTFIQHTSEWIFMTDEQGVVVEWNQGAEDITGLERSAVIGKPLWDVQYQLVSDTHKNPAMYKRLKSTYLEALRTGASPIMNRAVEAQFQRGDGQVRVAEQRLFPIRTAQGVRLSGISRDITERKQAEEALQSKVEFLRTLTEIDHEIIATTDPQGILDLVCRRAAGLVNVPKSTITAEVDRGMVVAAHFGLDDMASFSAVFQRLHQSGVLDSVSVDSRQTFAIDDLSANGLPPSVLESIEGIRAILVLPLVAHERAAGALTMFDTRPHAWRADEIEVLSILAGQAAIALANARLHQAEREQRVLAEALANTATALNSTLDFDELMDQVLANVGRVVPHDAASIMVIESGIARVVRSRGFAKRAVTEVLTPLRFKVDDVDNLRRMRETGQAVIIEDTHAAPDWVDIAETNWIASSLGAPLKVKDQVIGFISLESAVPKFFTPLHAAHLQSFADQVASALLNTRLLAETERRAEQFELLYDAGLTLNQLLESRAQFESLFNIVLKSLHADRVEFFRYDQPHGQLRFETGIGYTDEQLQLISQKLNFAIDAEEVIVTWVARHNELLYLPDVLADPRWIAVDPSVRSAVWVPIHYEDHLLGVLGVLALRENAFSSQDQRLLTLFANQAAGALENARLLAETKHGAEQSVQLYEAARDLSLERDLPRLLVTIVERAKLLLAASSGFIYLYDRERNDLELTVENDFRIPLGTRLGLDEGMAGQVAQTREPLLINDYETWEGRSPQYTGVPFRAVLEVPMLFAGELIGVLGINEMDESTRRYTEADIRLLSLFAHQASGAVQNAQSLEAERSQRQRLDILYRAGQAINSTLDVGTILDRLTDQAMRVTRATHGSVLVARVEQGYFERRSLRGYSTDLAEKAQADRLSLEDRLNGRAFQTGEVVYLPNVRADPDYFPLVPQTRAEMAVPIVQNGQVIGNLDLQSPEPDAFHDADPSFLKALTDQVAVALEKARLFEEVQQHAVELEDRVTRRTQELMAANARLTELDRLKDQFISMVSHEYRTPLTTILSSAELLEHYSARWSEDQKQNHLRRIVAAVKHMTDLLEGILFIGKIAANKLDFVPVPIDPEKYCRELVEEFQLTAGGQYHLTLISRAPCLGAKMDVNLLRHILTNVLSNAVKYSPRGGDIEFELICQDNDAVFQVRDHGIGIPKEDQARNFESFHRGSNIGNIPGTGLGMVIVSRSVALHHGTIQIESEVGVGTTVTITLPLGNSTTHPEAA